MAKNTISIKIENADALAEFIDGMEELIDLIPEWSRPEAQNIGKKIQKSLRKMFKPRRTKYENKQRIN